MCQIGAHCLNFCSPVLRSLHSASPFLVKRRDFSGLRFLFKLWVRLVPLFILCNPAFGYTVCRKVGTVSFFWRGGGVV